MTDEKQNHAPGAEAAPHEPTAELGAERDAYRHLALAAESNELALRRRLMPLMDAELERLRARVAGLERELAAQPEEMLREAPPGAGGSE